MVDIVRLTAQQKPPKDKDWLWISRDSSGRYRCEGSASLKKELGAAPDVTSSVTEDDLNVLVERAREWAGSRNIATLYLSE
jgi:hypothetical protein